MKIGRNEKCWCDSGEKFKHCHYGRESESSISKGDAFKHSKKNSSRKCCYVPDELKNECSKKIINAHTISKSGSLKEIADDSNHVLGLKIDLQNLIKNNGKLIPEKVGINQASTFKGFCSNHDKDLFSCVEDREFIGDEEQCLALMYRSVAKELYAKEGALNTSEFMKGSDKGKSPIDQLFIQNYVAMNEAGTKAAIKEILELKSQLDSQLLGTTIGSLSHLIIKSSLPMPVAVSSVFSPTADFDGNMVQDLADLSISAEQLVFNSFSSDGKGYVVFSWEKSSTKVLGFINSFLTIAENKIFGSLVRFFYGVAENTFTSPIWWDGLTNRQKDKIKNLIMSGVNPMDYDPKDILLDDGIDFSGWEIDSLSKVNF
jgi:hypothetical protein